MSRSYAVLTEGLPITALPSGLIVLWRGDKAPDGWLVCDGKNGTPNLTSHVPKGPGFRLIYIQKT